MNKYAAGALVLLVAVRVACGAAGALPVDGYAAKVNDRVVTISDVMAYVQPTDQQLRDVYTGLELQKKREEAFESGLQALIERALILEDFATLENAKIPDRVVNDRINELINEQFHNDRAAFQAALIAEQMTLEDWREETKDRLIVSILRRQEITDKVKVSPSRVIQLYEARHSQYAVPASVRLHVIVINQGKTDAEREVKRQQAVVARGKLLAEEDFADVAKAFSEGTKATEGGDWGWLDPDNLLSELKASVGSLKIGEISDIIEVGDTFYILQVEGRKAAGIVPFEQVRPQLESELKQAEADRLYNEWMQRLRRKHYVQIF